MAKNTCTVEGCERFVAGWSFCDLHYRRFVRLGSVHLPPGPTQEQRFWSKVDKAGPVPEARPELGPCWLWTALIRYDGYGSFSLGAHSEGPGMAHRFAYEATTGPITPGLVLDHLCRVRHCVNPSHLEPVTQLVNVLRGETIPAANAAKTHCWRGHLFDEANTYRHPRRPRTRDCRACRRISQEAHRRARLNV